MYRNFVPGLVAGLWLVLWVVAAPAGAALPVSSLAGEVPSLAPMLKQVMPAVVNISTRGSRSIANNPLLQDPFFRRFFDFPDRPLKRRTQSLGSGVIIDADKGVVVTNSHVIENAETITVTLQDGRNFEAEMIGADPDTDIAVMRIEPEDLADVPLGDSDVLEVGDFVVAIGNPFGLNQTVTSGIVSALGRDGLGIEGYEDFIQTDASINPGNSGGALVNLKGELIGINTAILAPAGGNVGIGFAIPINMAAQITEQLISHGRVKRGRLGVYVQDLTPELAQAFGAGRARGALIAQIIPDSPAAKSGLREGDLVVSINNRRIDDAADLLNAIGLLRVGQELEIGIVRRGEERIISARIDEAVEETRAGKTLHRGLSGAEFVESGTGSGTEGVLVDSVDKRSSAWSAGLRVGDLIVGVNRYRVRTLDDFSSVAAGADELLIELLRDGRAYYTTID